MATARTDHEFIFDCPICLEQYNIPRFLPCLHTFCTQCIQSYVESFATKNPGDESIQYIECPVCRQRVVAPKPNITSEEWANTLPVNHLLLSLQDMNDDHEASEDSVLCEPCTRVNERKTALFYCSNCDEKLCKSCYKYIHRRIPQFINHNVTEISVSILTPSKSTSYDIDHCSIHKNHLVTFFCFDHEELSCSACYDAIHHKCAMVKPIDVVTEEFNEKQLEHTSCVVASLKKKLDSEIKKTTTNLQQVEELQKSIKEDVITLVNDAKIQLDELQDKFLKNLEVIHAYEKPCIQNKQTCLENFVQILTNCELALKKANAKGPLKVKFLTKERVKMDLLRHFDDFVKHESYYSSTAYKWGENTMLKRIKEMENIGNVQVIHEKSDLVSDLRREIKLFKTPQNIQSPTQIPLKKEASTVPVVNYLTSFFVKCQEDETTPWITDGEFLNNGSLMIVDKKNSSIKKVSSTGTTEVLFKHSGDIRGICTTDEDNKVFLSVDDTISEFSVSPTFRYMKNFSNEKMEFYQLVARQDSIFAHTGNPWCVRIFSKRDGKIFKTLTGSSCGYGYFALSRNGNQIIYSKPGSVVCDEVATGNEVFQWGLKELGTARKSIKGIGVDFQDNIYICDSKGSSIIQISNDGKYIRNIIPTLHQIKKPYAICFDKSGKKFFVSSWLETHGKIEVYELSP